MVYMCELLLWWLFFFFKQKTAYEMRISDWSSDVCSSDLLSGGLDSSLVAACAARFARRRVEDDDGSEAWWPRLHSFAIGLEGSPDLAAARVAADALGTVHHGFTYTVEEGIDALPDVIRHIESFDVTTVRASTPMFLLARRIKAMG